MIKAMERITELYGKTSTEAYKEKENKNWLSDEQKEEWENAYRTLAKLSRLDVKMCQRLLLLANIQSLCKTMLEDIEEDLIQ